MPHRRKNLASSRKKNGDKKKGRWECGFALNQGAANRKRGKNVRFFPAMGVLWKGGVDHTAKKDFLSPGRSGGES